MNSRYAAWLKNVDIKEPLKSLFRPRLDCFQAAGFGFDENVRLRITILAPHRDTGIPTEVELSKFVPPYIDDQWRFYDFVYQVVADVIHHEVAEAFWAGGKRLHEPHTEVTT